MVLFSHKVNLVELKIKSSISLLMLGDFHILLSPINRLYGHKNKQRDIGMV